MKVTVSGIAEVQRLLDSKMAAIIKSKKEEILPKVVEALRDATPVDTGEARDGWHVENDKIVNNVEHISMLNEGSSKQAPSHFVEKTIISTTGIRPNGSIVTYL